MFHRFVYNFVYLYLNACPCRTEGDDVEIVDAPAASAEELKRKAKAGGEVVEDGVVCIE